jgi:hypothetical protein
VSLWRSPKNLATAGVLLIGVSVHDDVRVGAACLITLALMAAAPPVARWPLALMAGLSASSALDAPLAAMGSALGVALAVGSSAASLRSWKTFAAAFVALVAGLATGVPRWAGAALFMGLIALTPLEGLVSRWLLRAVLVVALVLPAISIARAELVLLQASPADTDLARAGQICASMSDRSCSESVCAAQARRLLSRGDPAGALSILQGLVEPSRVETGLLLADAEVRLGKRSDARLLLHRLAQRSPERIEPELSAETAELWSRARARERPPPVPASGARVSFSGAIQMLGFKGPAGCVSPGATVHLDWKWEVGNGFSPAENMWAFVHGDGPGRMLSFDHQVGGRPASTLSPGEVVDDPVDGVIPLGSAPGRYLLHLGFYDPSNGLRLHPWGQPGHVDFAEVGSIEVCP